MTTLAPQASRGHRRDGSASKPAVGAMDVDSEVQVGAQVVSDPPQAQSAADAPPETETPAAKAGGGGDTTDDEGDTVLKLCGNQSSTTFIGALCLHRGGELKE